AVGHFWSAASTFFRGESFTVSSRRFPFPSRPRRRKFPLRRQPTVPRESAMLLDRLVRLLLPRQDRFFVLLESLADAMVKAAGVFAELDAARGVAQLEAIAGRLKPLETDADNVCHEIYAELDSCFVTPIDREDIA